MAQPIKYVDPNIEKELIKYNFPGNIRELKNMVERALIICDGEELLLDHFQYNQKNISNEVLPSTDENQSMDLEQTEKNMILKALEQSDGNKSKAAALLNITWQSLDRRMKKYEL